MTPEQPTREVFNDNQRRFRNSSARITAGREPAHARQGGHRRHRRTGGAAGDPGQCAEPCHQDRTREPADRSARRLRRGRWFHSRTGARHSLQGTAERRPHLSGPDHQQGQPVQRQPRRRSRVRIDPRRQGRPHRRLRNARYDQSGGRPGRGQRGALHHHQLPVAALLFRTQGRSGQGLHLDLSLLLGPRGRHRRVPGAVGFSSDQQGRGRPVPQRCRRQRLGRSAARPAAGAGAGGLQAHRSRPLSGHEQRLHVADLGVQGGRMPRSSPAT